eukprot:scaffold137058_cov31-Prasinocladus_malaysianus.AAC.2
MTPRAVILQIMQSMMARALFLLCGTRLASYSTMDPLALQKKIGTKKLNRYFYFFHVAIENATTAAKASERNLSIGAETTLATQPVRKCQKLGHNARRHATDTLRLALNYCDK